ncbi:MAG: polysaccharide pyruvyl transferase family protein [Desulfobulbaceae bacterium]|nr:polysaccharide pyruvyl transferase family protein [Desulfobulbaceae bacterium]
MMKILITNTVALNGGDSAILYSLMNLLHQTFGEETEITVFDNAPQTAQRYHPHINFHQLLYISAKKSFSNHKISRFIPHSLVKLRYYFCAWCWKVGLRFITRNILSKNECDDIDLYNSADLIVSTGGTYLVENYTLTSRIFDFNISLLMGKPLVFFTQSLGPFRRPANRKKLRRIFNKSLLIFVRDKASHRHLQELNINMGKVSVFPDVVFALSPPRQIQIKHDSPSRINKPIHVAISVRHWKHFKSATAEQGMNNYTTVIRSAVEYLVRKYSARITFISTCQGICEYQHDDSILAEKIYANLSKKIKSHVVVDKNFHSPEQLCQFLISVDLVISTRMHMAILSLLTGVPVLSISYEFKTKELFKQLGQDTYCHDIETMTEQHFQKSLDHLIENRRHIQKDIVKEIKKQKSLVMQSAELLKEEYLKRQHMDYT